MSRLHAPGRVNERQMNGSRPRISQATSSTDLLVETISEQAQGLVASLYDIFSRLLQVMSNWPAITVNAGCAASSSLHQFLQRLKNCGCTRRRWDYLVVDSTTFVGS